MPPLQLSRLSRFQQAIPRILPHRLQQPIPPGVLPLSLQRHLLRIWNAIQADNLPANVKYAMELQQRRAGEVGAPMPKTSPAQAAAIREVRQGAWRLREG